MTSPRSGPGSEPGCACGCGPNRFSARDASADLERYRKKGPDATTRALLDAIVGLGIEGRTVLDIGSGVGVVAIETLAAGAARVDAVEASEPYVEVANREATRRGLADRWRTRLGDFVELADELAPADIVTLDRVICCYPDLPTLLGGAAGRATRAVGLVYPRSTWWNRLFGAAEDFAHRVMGDPNRAWVHPEAEVDGLLRRAGFEPRPVTRTLIWQIVLYVRPAAVGLSSGG